MLTGMGSRERHWRMARKTEFDVCEINIGGYYMARDRGEPLTAIPVFLHRRFRHGFVFVNAKSGIREPKDLIGKKIGGTNFQPASNIWMRGILEQYYGVPHQQCTWVVEREEDFEFTPPKDLNIEMAPPEKRLDVMLAEGEIPAMLSPDLPKLFQQGDKRIVRLFPNYKDIEIEFFRNTGIFPIMHVNACGRRSSTNIRGSRPIWSKPSMRPRRWPIAGSPIRASCRSPGSGPHGKNSSTSWVPTLGLMVSATPIAKISRPCCAIAISRA